MAAALCTSYQRPMDTQKLIGGGPSASPGGGAQAYKRNVYMLSVGFFGIFMAFQTAQNLATSTLVGNQGNEQLGLLYGCFTIAAIFAPSWVETIGPRIAMAAGGVTYALYIMSFLVTGSFAVVMVAGALVGFGAAFLWTAEGMYLGRCALNYARLTGQNDGEATGAFNGIFFSVFQFCPFIGNMVGYIVLTSSNGNHDDANRILFIVLSACAGAGCLVLFFLKKAEPVEDEASKSADKISLIQTLKLLGSNIRMQCFAPLIFYNGVSLGYYFTTYNGSLVKPSLGGNNVPLVVAAFFLVNSIASFVFGKLVTVWGRRAIMTVATLAHAIFFVVLIAVNANDTSAESYAYYFILAALFAIGDSVWESFPPAILQNPAMFHADVDRSAAMGNYKMLQSLGFVPGCLLKVFGLDTQIQAIVLLVLLIASVLPLVYMDRSVVPLDSDKAKSEPLIGVSDSNSQK